jgi:hypothetical protein
VKVVVVAATAVESADVRAEGEAVTEADAVVDEGATNDFLIIRTETAQPSAGLHQDSASIHTLVGFESHKAHPDLGRDSGFWLRVRAEDASPFVTAFKASAAAFRGLCLRRRDGNCVQCSRDRRSSSSGRVANQLNRYEPLTVEHL